MEAQQRSIGGHTVRWLQHGAGTPVVLVHGIPTSPRLWRHVMPLVNGRALAWEMPGYGTSIPDGQGRDLGLSQRNSTSGSQQNGTCWARPPTS